MPNEQDEGQGPVFWSAILGGAAVVLALLGTLLVTSSWPPRVAADKSDTTATSQPSSETSPQLVEIDADQPERIEEKVEFNPITALQTWNLNDWRMASDEHRQACDDAVDILIKGTDPNISLDGTIGFSSFLGLLGHEHDDRRLIDLAESYKSEVKGVIAHFEGQSAMTTDSFHYPGDGYVVFHNSGGSEFYSVSLYNDETAEIEKAGIFCTANGEVALHSRLRLAAGMYYFEVQAAAPWQIVVVTARGMEYLKRAVDSVLQENTQPERDDFDA